MTAYVLFTTVAAVTPVREARHLRGVGKEAESENITTGYLLTLRGDHHNFSFFLREEPKLTAGDPISLRICKEDPDANRTDKVDPGPRAPAPHDLPPTSGGAEAKHFEESGALTSPNLR